MAPPRRPEIVIGLDVGKSSHWACVASRDGEVLLSAPVANRESELDSLFARFPGALVVVDQSRNIGALALSRAKAAGMPSAYLPGLAAHEASKLFGGDAKTDERDAMVIAKTALGIPDALLPVVDREPEIRAARSLAAHRDFLTCESTRNKNRLRSILLESCPEFEALVDLSDASVLRLMAELGGPWSVAAAGRRRAAALTRGASHDRLASYCGLAPRNRQSGTSVSSVSASRQGNKRLKNLLIFSCNCLARTDGRWGEYYARCRERGMPHGKALKAVARKRLKVIYAVMRDKAPYVA